MSRVLLNRVFAKDTFKVNSTVIGTGWKAGQFFQLNSLSEAVLAVTDGAIFMGVDSTTELSAPPTGSQLTGIYGAGTKVFIDHSDEVAAGDTARAYNTTCESGSVSSALYIDASGKLTTTSTGSQKGVMIQVPAAGNNYTIGVIFRI